MLVSSGLQAGSGIATDSANGGTVCIEEYRDIVYLCDTAADGLAPRMNVATQSSSGQYNTRYTLTIGIGNRNTGFTTAGNLSVIGLTDTVPVAASRA